MEAPLEDLDYDLIDFVKVRLRRTSLIKLLR